MEHFDSYWYAYQYTIIVNMDGRHCMETWSIIGVPVHAACFYCLYVSSLPVSGFDQDLHVRRNDSIERTILILAQYRCIAAHHVVKASYILSR